MNINQLSSYQEEVAQYTKKDAAHALLFAAYIAFMSTVFLIFVTALDLRDDDLQISFLGNLLGVGMLPLYFVPLFVVIKKKRQGLRSVGLHLIDWKKALGAGLIFLITNLLLFEGFLPGLLAGWQMRSASMLTWFIAWLLIRAFFEDVMFIGYIQTRIHGLIKNEALAIFIVALIFAIIHYPGFIALNIASGVDFGFNFWGNLALYTLYWMTGYVFMNFVFRQLRSIIPVTLLHFSINIAQRGDLWEYRGDGGFNEIFSVIMIGIVLLSICVIKHRVTK